MFQSYNLFPHMTALQNITLAPRSVKGVKPAQAREQAMHCLLYTSQARSGAGRAIPRP